MAPQPIGIDQNGLENGARASAWLRILGRLSEPDREARRCHALKAEAVDLAARASLDLEPHVDDPVGPVFLSFAPQGLDGRLTVRFTA
jgi:hypothetical protein